MRLSVKAASGRQRSSGPLLVGLAAFILLFVLGIASAVAVGEEAEAKTFYSADALTEALDSNSLVELQSTDLEAAQQMPRDDVSREQAIDLLQAVFDLAPSESGPSQEAQADTFLSSNVGVVEPPAGTDSKSMLVESSLPLLAKDATGHQAPVDLGLEVSESSLQTANGLVELELPTELGNGISLPEQEVVIDLVDGPDDRAASIVEGGSAFYPNVAEDTDLTAVPTPTGFETFTQLRTSEAPLRQELALSLPDQAALVPTNEGGAEVRRGNDLLLSVSPPLAQDASGKEVPVALSVDADHLILDVSPTSTATYPILVDPLFETHDWPKYYGAEAHWYFTAMPGWVGASNTSSYVAQNWTVGEFAGHWGMTLISGSPPSSVVPASQATWNYYIPRFSSDRSQYNDPPSTYINNVILQQLQFRFSSDNGAPPSRQFSPYFVGGLWDYAVPTWITKAVRSGVEGQLLERPEPYVFPNPNGNAHVQNFGLALASSEYNANAERQVWASGATIELVDPDDPEILYMAEPQGWYDQTGPALGFSANDYGLGVHRVTTTPDTLAELPASELKHGCVGGAAKPCPRVWGDSSGSPKISYPAKDLPEGEVVLKVSAFDPVGHQSDSLGAPVLIDHTAPEIKTSGSLTEQATLGTGKAEYTLKYSAFDGDIAPPASLAPLGEPGTAAGKLQRPLGVAVDPSGNPWVVDRENKRVMKYGPNGEVLAQFSSLTYANGSSTIPFNDLRGIATRPDGTIIVADLGTKRVWEFSPSGVVKREVTHSYLLEPYAVAVAPDGALWVSDIGRRAVYKFSSTGNTLLARAKGTSERINDDGTDLASPVGLAVDRYGNVLVADNGTHRVIGFDKAGYYRRQFGQLGTAPGQLSGPIGLAVAPSGNIMVVDGTNNRLQEFRQDGRYIRHFGSQGAASGQLSEPRGVAFGPGNVVYVADAGNRRIARWSNADFNQQSGVVATEVRLDGSAVQKTEAGCASSSCAIAGREWTLQVDQIAGGSHKVDIVARDAVGRERIESINIQTRPDLVPPSIALSGAMTEQSTLGFSRPSYGLKAVASDPGGSQERQSGVASISVKVDGVVVSSSSPGCVPGGCSLTREWTLVANSYSVGPHTIQITAVDAAGRVATRTQMIEIVRDKTPPKLYAPSKLFTAPEGWLEQQNYSYSVSASDDGYGAWIMALSVDGKVIKMTEKSCPFGGCELSMSGTLDVAAYDGGAHKAELAVMDVAGNIARKAWTMNVDPKGPIGVEEAEDTLEAAEATNMLTMIAPATEGEQEGMVEGLELHEGDGELRASGSAAPVSVGTEPGAALTVEVPPASAFMQACEPGEVPDSDCLSPEEEELETPSEEDGPLVPVDISPTAVAESGSDTEIVSDSAAAVSSSVHPHVDLVARPLHEGGMIFAAIRDSAGSETFSWSVQLSGQQKLKLLDPQRAQVYYPTGLEAFTISARPARDAIGSSVPTSLSVAGNIISLTVSHRGNGPDGKPFIYPVVAGTGWQGGIQTFDVQMPPPEPLPGEAEEVNQEVGYLAPGIGRLTTDTFGPPVASLSKSPDGITPGPVKDKVYVFNECTWEPDVAEGEGGKGLPPLEHLARISQQCHGRYKGAYGSTYKLRWAVAVHGHFNYVFGQKVWINTEPDCSAWAGQDVQHLRPEKKGCYATAKWSNSRLDVIGKFRWDPAEIAGSYAPFDDVCAELDGVLAKSPTYPDGENIFHRMHHWSRSPVDTDDPCPWGHLEQVF